MGNTCHDTGSILHISFSSNTPAGTGLFKSGEKLRGLLGIETYIVIVLSPREEALAKRPSGRALQRYQVEGD